MDALRDSAERCRKIDMAAKAAMGVGVGLLLVSFFWFTATALVIGIAAVLGSVALVGSIVEHSARSSPGSDWLRRAGPRSLTARGFKWSATDQRPIAGLPLLP